LTAYRFCPKCGGGLLAQLMEGQERLLCEGCGFVLYVNPRPTACAVIVERDEVMLVRRAVAPAAAAGTCQVGFWSGASIRQRD